MKKKTKIILASVTGAVALTLAGGGYWFYKTFTPQETAVDKNATVATNYYQAINKDWLEKAEIPADAPATNDFYALSDSIKDKLKADIKNLAEGKETSDIAGMSSFITFYKAANDTEQREKDGLEPLKPLLKRIEDIKDVQDLASKYASLSDEDIALPFAFGVGENLENTSQKQMSLSAAGTLLPDVSLYANASLKEQYLAPVKTAGENAFKMLGYSEKDSQRIVEEALAFDEILAKYSLSNEEASETKNLHHPKTAAEINAYSEDFKLYDVIKNYMGRDLDVINVPNPKFFENLSDIVNDKNFSKLKSWMLYQQAASAESALTEEYRLNFAQISMAWSGTQEPASKEDVIYNQTIGTFSDVFSVYYGRKYFGEEAKQDVTNMINQFKTVYRGRLEKNDWLSPETRAKAIEKVDKMKVFVGYPEDVDPATKEVHLEEGKSFYEQLEALNRFAKRYIIDHFDDPIDKDQWAAPSFEVNAYYNPSNNSVNFPAAILQAPFYDNNQSKEKNYGGIGVVIGHEMTHAFDSNGADFDENGNLVNWWTAADSQAFDQKIEAFVKQWDGLEIYGGKVNGKLTVTENVADAGGLSASLEVVKGQTSQPNLKDFFENYANIWKQKASLQYNNLLLLQDTHAPNELRVNQQLKNLADFYDTYPEIKEGDTMYLAPDQRIHLW